MLSRAVTAVALVLTLVLVGIELCACALEVTLPSTGLYVKHLVAYSPRAENWTHTIVYTVNTSATNLTVGVPSAWSWKIIVEPYYNKTGYLTPDKNATILGTWLYGTVQDLADFDNVFFAFRSYNDSNTMRLVLTLNITSLGWLVADATFDVAEIEIVIAGNLSKTVNTRASLEILDWDTGTWISIDDAALNQTSDTQKVYYLSQIVGDGLSRFISSTGVIALRINVTDVQTHPSTYVDLSLDQLVVRVTYVNETEAKVVSTVVITVPYGTARLDNVTLYVRANGTGTSRMVSIEVLNATGNVIASLANATFTTSWTAVSIPVNQSVISNVTVRITVKLISGLAAPEEVDIGFAKVWFTNETWRSLRCTLSTGPEHSCVGSFWIDLGDTAYLNISTVEIYLHKPLNLTVLEYPVAPVYRGNVSLAGEQYLLYIVENANTSGTVNLTASLPNTLYERYYAETHGVNTTILMVGDVICVHSAYPANITMSIDAWSETWTNTTTACTVINATGILNVTLLRVLPLVFDLGYGTLNITVSYGVVKIYLRDYDNAVLDYLDLVGGITHELGRVSKTFSIRGAANVTELWAGNYTVVIYYLYVPVCRAVFTLDTLSNNSAVNLTCTVKRLGLDYRGGSRITAWTYTAELVYIRDLDSRHPLARLSIALNGSGSICVAIRYTSRPTTVLVSTNMSSASWSWSDSTLVICGTLSSVGVVNTSDAYYLSVYIVDKLGRLLDELKPHIRVNSSYYVTASLVTALPVAVYEVEVPGEIDGFIFDKWSDGETSRVRLVDLTSDISLSALYRIPTKFEYFDLSLLKETDKLAVLSVSGRLVDYFGSPVADRNITIYVYIKEYGWTSVFTAKTDSNGWFTAVFTVPKNVTVTARAHFSGDEIYREAHAGPVELRLKPVAPPPPPPPTFVVVLPYAAALAVIGIGAIAVIYLARKTAARRTRTRTPVFA